MKKAVLLFLFVFATSAWAQNNQDQRNIYHTLTSDQFDRLAEASREIAAGAVLLQGKIVFMAEDGKIVSAVGRESWTTSPIRSTSLGFYVFGLTALVR